MTERDRHPDDPREREEELPEHEFRDIEGQSVGGGVMRSGGTAVDRGTGTLGGTAQGPDDPDSTDTPVVDVDAIDDTPAAFAALDEDADSPRD